MIIDRHCYDYFTAKTVVVGKYIKVILRVSLESPGVLWSVVRDLQHFKLFLKLVLLAFI